MEFEKFKGDNNENAENQEKGPDSDYRKPPPTQEAVGVPREQETGNDFSSARSWEELFSQIDERGHVAGSKELFSSKELKKRINDVRSGSLQLEAITRARGLRAKVEELLEQDEEERALEKGESGGQ